MFENWSARIYEHGRGFRYEVRMPSGGGWNSKVFWTRGGAKKALQAAMKRIRARHVAVVAQ